MAGSRGRVRAGAIGGGVVAVVTFFFVFFLQWLPLIDNPVSSAFGAFAGDFLVGFYLRFRDGD